MTDNMKAALIQLHGCSRTAKEMRQDTRTLKALQARGFVRAFQRGRSIFWVLTPEGVAQYNSAAA